MAIIPISSVNQYNHDDILGLWYNEEKTGKIRIYKENNKFYGKLIWVDLKPGDTGLDENNPDDELKSRPLVNLVILKDFKFKDDEYENGKIYDPESGKTFSCAMHLENENRLYVRGYIGFSLIGRTTYWTRIE